MFAIELGDMLKNPYKYFKNNQTRDRNEECTTALKLLAVEYEIKTVKIFEAHNVH